MDNLSRSARRITSSLFFAQSLGSAGFIAVATLNGIVATRLAGSAAWAGVPSAVYLLGSAGAAFVWGYLMDLIGRRNGIALGLALSTAGAVLAVLAFVGGAFLPFLVSMVLIGTGSAALTLGRFAAAEVQKPEARGRAISNVILGGTVGAILGPLLIGPSGAAARAFGLDELSGAYAVSTLLFAASAAVILAGLRPDPLDLGREVALLFPPDTSAPAQARSLGEILRTPASVLAVAAMVVGQVVMVSVMVITALYMHEHQHSLGHISTVFAAHTIGMYAFSVLSGRLTDRWGRGPVILLGSGTLILACLAASLSPELVPLAVSLFLLGLGWNLCFVGGSTLLSDQLTPAERGRTQGTGDLLVGLASSAGSLGSGLVFAAVGFDTMAIMAATLAVIPVALTAIWMRSRARPVPTPEPT